MATPTSKATLLSYIKRKLGHPVIQINVSDEQIDDRIDEALQKFRSGHEDASERIFLKHQITATDKTNNYISIDTDINAITRILAIAESSAYSSSALFNVPYNIRLNDVFAVGGGSVVNYALTMQHLALLDRMFSQEPLIEFNKHQNRLYLYTDWDEITAGTYIIIECFRILDGDTYTDIWNDSWLKAYATQLVKLQWGENLSKYSDVRLPGGSVLNGERIMQEAREEIISLKESLVLEYQEPVMFKMG
jgi:hypothetical protein